jgi:hypothetical protein
VAVIAGIGRFEANVVIRRSASGDPGVMASQTLPGNCSPVVVACAKERKGIEVAALARRIGHDVAGGFRCRHDALAHCVATVASPRCALEHTSDVAGFARRHGVPAKKREAGGRVIEAAPGRLRFGHSVQ